MAPKCAGLSGRPLHLAITAVSTMGFLLFGYDQGVMAGIISADQFTDVFTAAKGDNVIQATITAVYELGCFAGAIYTLIFGDRFGRRWTIIPGATIMIIGVIIQVTAFVGHIPLLQFMFGRVITGIGNGMNTATIPTYQAECSKANRRGLNICIEGGTVAIGTMVAYWIDFGTHYATRQDIRDVSWRFPIAFQIIFGLIIIFGVYALPESPRWLLTKERFDEAEHIMAALMNSEISDPDLQNEKERAMESIQAAGAVGKTSYKDLFTGGPTQHFRRMIVGSSSQIFQQLGGCNAVIYYLPVLLEQSLNESHDQALLIGGFNMVVYAVFATFSWFFVEMIGRRKLFLGGTIFQLISMIITFVCLIPHGRNPKKGAIFGFFLYMATFGATWLPLPWLYPAELSPTRTRAKANAVSTCANWLFNFTVVMITPVMVEHIGWRTYLFFAVMNAWALPTIYFFYPETAGRTLEEIDMIFEKGFVENISYVRAAKELPPLREILGDRFDDGEKGMAENRENVGAPETREAPHEKDEE